MRVRYRIRFAKVGLLRWISHRDLATLWERLARRVRLPLSMTEGFHPKPRIGFPSALALGIESLDEVVEIELTESPAPADLLAVLAGDRQPGLLIRSVARLPEGFGKARLQSADYVITIPADADLAAVESSIQRLKDEPHVSVQRKQKTVTADLSQQVPVMQLCDASESHDRVAPDPQFEHQQRLHLSMNSVDGAALKPGDVLELMNVQHWIPAGSTITRTRIVLVKDFTPDDPDQYAVASPPGSEHETLKPSASM
ncbi:TIGR03936 family radical SAM-associated protein [Crateriforma conspicua]|uniref:TIGR03936 family radical SAM-associated protein n=1 Tax=Crateriforma conspicua TaxID=2527996 RepID=UPI00118A8E96|nr:TIGR03936 family radical SAM-associated protein [Crateriforma conspicua]QDV62172.1 hypothetical protein Mal65_13050 [Crateriforma conspicua]